MNLNDFIAKGIEKTGTIRELAKLLGQQPTSISEAKHGKRGLPAYACVKLAQMIGVSEMAVLAASELATEKNPERRAVWAPFVQEIAANATTRIATLEEWRRGWDSNPRYLAVRLISSQVHSTTLPPLRGGGF